MMTNTARAKTTTSTLLKVAMTRKNFIAWCERISKTLIQVLYTFALQRFVDDIFQFEFFVFIG